jgi:hypothetical protein
MSRQERIGRLCWFLALWALIVVYAIVFTHL